MRIQSSYSSPLVERTPPSVIDRHLADLIGQKMLNEGVFTITRSSQRGISTTTMTCWVFSKGDIEELLNRLRRLGHGKSTEEVVSFFNSVPIVESNKNI